MHLPWWSVEYLLAQIGDETAMTVWEQVVDLADRVGVVAALLLFAWLVHTERIVPGSALKREQAQWQARHDALEERFRAVKKDRDDWRAAHAEEALARREAELANRKLLEASDMLGTLVEAFRDAATRSGPSGTGPEGA